MSIPSFPELDPDFTTRDALNMLIASIAAEEKALAEIYKGESQKIKYVMEKHRSHCGCPTASRELIAVNNSVAALLESAADNQMLLKNKLRMALDALGRLVPPCPEPKPCYESHSGSEVRCEKACSAQFYGERGYQELHTGQYVRWNEGKTQGCCVRRCPQNGAQIKLCDKGRYLVSVSVDAKSVGGRGGPFALTLQCLNNGKYTDLFTLHGILLFSGAPVTIGTAALVVDIPKSCYENFMMLRLDGPECLGIEQARFTVVQLTANH